MLHSASIATAQRRPTTFFPVRLCKFAEISIMKSEPPSNLFLPGVRPSAALLLSDDSFRNVSGQIKRIVSCNNLSTLRCYCYAAALESMKLTKRQEQDAELMCLSSGRACQGVGGVPCFWASTCQRGRHPAKPAAAFAGCASSAGDWS